MAKIVHRLSLAVGLVLFGAACAGGGGGGVTSQETQSPVTGGELRVGFLDDQYVLEGPRVNLGMYPLNTNVTETLIYLTPQYEMKPMLAERWEFRPPNTWRFFLRKGVTFHDGQSFNARAVKEGLFDRLAKIEGGSTIKAGPNSAVVVDEHTIDFTPTVPNLRVPQQIVHPSNGVVAPGSDLAKHPVGTGPFKFLEYLPKERIVVERFDGYWGSPAKLDRITFRFYPDPSARRLALEAGDVDFIYEVPRPDVATLRGRFKIETSAAGAMEAMYANMHGEPPFDLLRDVRLRHAIAYGIDRDKLINGVLDGLATDDQTFIPPLVLGGHASLIRGFSYDPARAKSLIEQAGWRPGADGIYEKDGRRLHLRLVSGFPSAEVHRPIPTFLQSQLREIGMEVEIVERPDSESFYDLMKKKEGDLWLEQGNQNDANPSFLPVLLFYTGPGTSGTGSTQGIAAPGGKFNELLAPVLTEVDLDKVQRATAEAMHVLVDEETTVIPLAGIFRIYGMAEGVEGFEPHPSFLSTRWDRVSVNSG